MNPPSNDKKRTTIAVTPQTINLNQQQQRTILLNSYPIEQKKWEINCARTAIGKERETTSKSWAKTIRIFRSILTSPSTLVPRGLRMKPKRNCNSCCRETCTSLIRPSPGRAYPWSTTIWSVRGIIWWMYKRMKDLTTQIKILQRATSTMPFPRTPTITSHSSAISSLNSPK